MHAIPESEYPPSYPVNIEDGPSFAQRIEAAASYMLGSVTLIIAPQYIEPIHYQRVPGQLELAQAAGEVPMYLTYYGGAFTSMTGLMALAAYGMRIKKGQSRSRRKDQ
ncbi:MAG TPA: hypothetical protein VF733_02835 [Candidatus Saccharimonadales bacterium]